VDTGWKVSLGGHGALLMAILVGWPFASDTESAAPQTVNVTLVTMDEMPVAGAPTPPRAEAPVEIDDIAALAPELAPEEAPRPPEPPARPARPDPEPEAKAPTPPKPATPAAPPPPVDRVAPVPQPAPPKDLPEADQQQEAVKQTPEPAPQTTRTEEQEAAAPKEAAPQIVTEAVETSPRPDRRPARPEPVAAAEPEPEAEPEVAETPETREPEPEPEPVKDPPKPKTEPKAAPKKQPDVNSALAEAMAADPGPAQAEPQSSGPPLTQGERDGLRVAVSRCWNIAALSTESAQVTVIVGMEMSLDGVPSNLRMVSYSGGTEAAAQQAYETARRAVLRCQPYSLPAEKYDQWRTIEMTFNPDEMRRR
jgi:hypothetical protein